MEKVKIRDIFIDNTTVKEAVEKTVELSKNGFGNIVITPNAEIAQLCHEDEKLSKSAMRQIISTSKCLKRQFRSKIV